MALPESEENRSKGVSCLRGAVWWMSFWYCGCRRRTTCLLWTNGQCQGCKENWFYTGRTRGAMQMTGTWLPGSTWLYNLD